jgi:hypothetical protein
MKTTWSRSRVLTVKITRVKISSRSSKRETGQDLPAVPHISPQVAPRLATLQVKTDIV